MAASPKKSMTTQGHERPVVTIVDSIHTLEGGGLAWPAVCTLAPLMPPYYAMPWTWRPPVVIWFRFDSGYSIVQR